MRNVRLTSTILGSSVVWSKITVTLGLDFFFFVAMVCPFMVCYVEKKDPGKAHTRAITAGDTATRGPSPTGRRLCVKWVSGQPLVLEYHECRHIDRSVSLLIETRMPLGDLFKHPHVLATFALSWVRSAIWGLGGVWGGGWAAWEGEGRQRAKIENKKSATVACKKHDPLTQSHNTRSYRSAGSWRWRVSRQPRRSASMAQVSASCGGLSSWS